MNRIKNPDSIYFRIADPKEHKVLKIILTMNTAALQERPKRLAVLTSLNHFHMIITGVCHS